VGVSRPVLSSSRVVKDDAEREAQPLVNAAHAVSQLGAVDPLGAFDGPIAIGEHDRFALLECKGLTP